jgi:acyl-CoA thioesterase FadM
MLQALSISHFFRFVEHAEEELFRSAGKGLQQLLQEHEIWMPRVEAFTKFSKPIPLGGAIRVRLQPQIQGEKRFVTTLRSSMTAAATNSPQATSRWCAWTRPSSRPRRSLR